MKRTSFKGLRNAARRVVTQFINEKSRIGFVLVSEMKATIDRGQSPIKDVGRFIKYKNPLVYPGKGKLAARYSKKRSPVNLTLTGDMLHSFDVKTEQNKISVGIFDNAEAIKMRALQAGKPPLAGPRPVFPSKKGEEFTVKITRALIREFRKLFKKANR